MDVSHTCGRASWVLRTSESSLDLNQAEQEPKKAKNVVLALFLPLSVPTNSSHHKN